MPLNELTDRAGYHVIAIRWRTLRPHSGYDLWDGDGWIPITVAEYRSYANRYCIHMNPPWANRG